MTSSFLRSFVSVASLGAAAAATAAPVLYYTAPQTIYGLRETGFDLFSQTVVSTFGAANIHELADFGTASQFADAAVLFVNARGQDPDALSAAERQNLKTFIDDGGAVFFVGEHGGWTTWNNSFLSLFGAQFTPWNSINAALPSGTAPTPFAQSGQLSLGAPGAISGGGDPLYGLQTYTMAARFGPQNNAIAFLDTYPLSGAHGSHFEFHQDVASWLFTTGSAYEASKLQTPPPSTVPDSLSTGTWGAFALALFAFVRRRNGGGPVAGSRQCRTHSGTLLQTTGAADPRAEPATDADGPN